MQKVYEQFQQYWAQFASQLKLENSVSESLLDLLFKAYSEPQRYYHTCQHIVECLDLFHDIKQDLHDPIAVELAIWFHDVVYDPQATDNELQSAELMKHHCQKFLTVSQLTQIYDWIVATQKHAHANDSDLKYLLDIDLAILGSNQTRFVEYEQQIQKEYAWVSPELYKIKRGDVLAYFYQMDSIYQSDYFSRLFEQRAKENLAQYVR